jgi:hypothetical protein
MPKRCIFEAPAVVFLTDGKAWDAWMSANGWADETSILGAVAAPGVVTVAEDGNTQYYADGVAEYMTTVLTVEARVKAAKVMEYMEWVMTMSDGGS